MNVTRKTDPYDSHKVWIVKHTKYGNIFISTKLRTLPSKEGKRKATRLYSK